MKIGLRRSYIKWWLPIWYVAGWFHGTRVHWLYILFIMIYWETYADN
jgi:hypothetical protein